MGVRTKIDGICSETDADIIDTLLGESDHLKEILRPHWEDEKGISDQGEIGKRNRLDDRLDRLMLYELAIETGCLEKTEVRTEAEKAKKLFANPAAQRFLEAYLYFGVRFFIGRLQESSPKAGEQLLPCSGPGENNKANAWQGGLPITRPLSGAVTGFDDFLGLFAKLKNDDLVTRTLKFLDDYVAKGLPRPREFRLWLSGVLCQDDRCLPISAGLLKWVHEKSELYARYNSDSLRARFAVFDFYWLARLLGAEVSPSGCVVYRGKSWLQELIQHADFLKEKLSDFSWEAETPEFSAEVFKSLREKEKILRDAFSRACDLIQEAHLVGAARDATPDESGAKGKKESEAIEWRFAFDRELKEIQLQRKERLYLREQNGDNQQEGGAPQNANENGHPKEWSHQSSQGLGIHDLTGVAFSGGGIRSATFGLGVLEGLKDIDLLRRVDYLSTVSGGGYIGSWLAANVCRSPFWLGKTANWNASITHLRRFSNYLSPLTGLLHADTWCMATTWFRNTFLIQLMFFAAISCGIAAARLIPSALSAWHDGAQSLPTQDVFWILPALLLLVVTGEICFNLRRGRCSQQSAPGLICCNKLFIALDQISSFLQRRVKLLIVAPLCLLSVLVAWWLWSSAQQGRLNNIHATFSEILLMAYKPWSLQLLFSWGCFFFVSYFSIEGDRRLRFFRSFVPASLCLVVIYIELCGIMRLLHEWIWPLGDYNCVVYPWSPLFAGWITIQQKFNHLSYVWVPALVLLSLSTSIVFLQGFISRYSKERTREWWTRLGAWLAIFGISLLLVKVVAIYGPLLVLKLYDKYPAGKWFAALAWLVTTGGGLLAGNSGETKGHNGAQSMSVAAKEMLAKVAGIIFIIGIFVLVSTVLYLFFYVNIDSSPQFDMKVIANFYWDRTGDVTFQVIFITVIVLTGITAIFSRLIDINVFSLNNFYRNRLVRCYLGATRVSPDSRHPQAFTGFDDADDTPLTGLATDPSKRDNFRGPFPIINAALNLGGSSDLSLHTRHSASFTFTPLYCGNSREAIGYAPTSLAAGKDALTLGQAMAVSGAAASPNMGYSTSPIVAFLLTIFNVRLGWWFPNPGKRKKNTTPKFGLRYLLYELLGMAGEKSGFVNISDGGHFENLGVYELVRRRCKFIIAVDSECDPSLSFGALGNMIRICAVDFGARIKINVNSICNEGSDGSERSHCAIGTIHYSNGSVGYLIYIKSSLTGDEDSAVLQYKASHLTFPHETTADQFFGENQFESYRRLGSHIVRRVFRDVDSYNDFSEIARVLSDQWTPAVNAGSFVAHAKELDAIWERLRDSPALVPLRNELLANRSTPNPAGQPSTDETCICLEVIQLMENVFIDLHLDDHWDHPDNRGWQQQFLAWAKSGTLRAVWSQTKSNFGSRFQYFCSFYLGL